MNALEAQQKLRTLLEAPYGSGEAQSIARIVLEDAFGIRHALENRHLSDAEALALEQNIIPRLLKGEPVQYIVGKASFFGYFFEVSPAVLIPRQETEELVAWALDCLKETTQTAQVLDIGTGSGCIPVVLAKKVKKAEVHALDISEEALKIVRRNAEIQGVDLRLYQADILDESQWHNISGGPFDLIVSNPPYIPPREAALMPRHVLDWEPQLALFSPEEDPCIFYRKIAAFACKKLRSGGTLLFEVNEFRAGEVVSILKDIGFGEVEVRKDLSGKERMVGGGKLFLSALQLTTVPSP